MPYMGPFSYGFMIGAGSACFETEVVNPVVSHLLKKWGDLYILGAECGVMTAAYMAYRNQSNNEKSVLKQPTAILGMLAGIVAWYHLHG